MAIGPITRIILKLLKTQGPKVGPQMARSIGFTNKQIETAIRARRKLLSPKKIKS